MNFQASANYQGKRFDEQCRWLLADAGWAVSETPMSIPECGVEIDCVATKPGVGVAWIEFKGSWRGGRPGLLRTDTVKKAIVTGYLLGSAAYTIPYVIMSSHLPAPGSAGAAMVRIAVEAGAVAGVVCINLPTWARDLERAVKS
jgi:hypothetical protein